MGCGEPYLIEAAKGGGVTDDARALELYQLALSIADAKGRVVVVGLMAYKEYRGEGLSIRYFPSTGHLGAHGQPRVR